MPSAWCWWCCCAPCWLRRSPVVSASPIASKASTLRCTSSPSSLCCRPWVEGCSVSSAFWQVCLHSNCRSDARWSLCFSDYAFPYIILVLSLVTLAVYMSASEIQVKTHNALPTVEVNVMTDMESLPHCNSQRTASSDGSSLTSDQRGVFSGRFLQTAAQTG